MADPSLKPRASLATSQASKNVTRTQRQPSCLRILIYIENFRNVFTIFWAIFNYTSKCMYSRYKPYLMAINKEVLKV